MNTLIKYSNRVFVPSYLCLLYTVYGCVRQKKVLNFMLPEICYSLTGTASTLTSPTHSHSTPHHDCKCVLTPFPYRFKGVITVSTFGTLQSKPEFGWQKRWRWKLLHTLASSIWQKYCEVTWVWALLFPKQATGLKRKRLITHDCSFLWTETICTSVFSRFCNPALFTWMC